MSAFSIIWLLVVLVFVFIPSVIEKKMKEAMKKASPKTPPVFSEPPVFEEEAKPEFPPRSPEILKKESFKEKAVLPVEGEKVVAGVKDKEQPLNKEPKKKFIVNPKDMVIYSAIMKPKFEED